MRKKITFLSVAALGALALLGAGCIKKETAPSTATLSPSISVSNQTLSSDNQVTINSASINDAGWMTIHEKQGDQPGPVIGYTYLSKGSATKIKVTVDKSNLSPYLIAMLHYDRGEMGVFEFPGADCPVIRDQQVIMTEFSLTNYADASKQPAPAKPVGARKEFVITAKQWSFSPSVIKVKKGDTVVLKLKSADVAHGISIPDFGINATFKPGEIKIVEFVADKAGTFEFICNVRCGVGHIGMKGTLIVE